MLYFATGAVGKERGDVKHARESDLRALAELETAERAFVSCYLCPADDDAWLERRARSTARLLAEEPEDREHFEAGMEMVREWLASHKTEAPAVCVFACYGLGFVRGFAIEHEVEPRMRLGPAPLIRPLAELEDAEPDFVFVTADNDAAAIYTVSAGVVKQRERVRGDIKNQVKKGGWSQKRYQRRRANELHHYAKEVADELYALHTRRPVKRLVIFGSLEARHAVVDALDGALEKALVGEDGADLTDDERELMEEAREFIDAAEMREERSLWKRIRAELLGGDLAEAGSEDVWLALANGRVEALMLKQGVELRGWKCRECENVITGGDDQTRAGGNDEAAEGGGEARCKYCDGDDLFELDLADEMVRQAERTSAAVEFTEDVSGLDDVGSVAALLRY